MKIGIIGAMEEEVTLLRDKIENRQTISLGGCEIYTGQLNGTEVALLKSGIGKVAAALGATLLLEHCKRSEERRVGKECRSRWSPYH